MANINIAGAYAKTELRGFQGIDEERLRDGVNASEMVNFRLSADGALEKRCGYGKIFDMPVAPRAVCSGYLDGEAAFCFLAEDMICMKSDKDPAGYMCLGIVNTLEGDAAITEFGGRLYVFDGDDIYVKADGTFKEVEGYIPLYGKDWDPYLLGEVLEAENILTGKVRIRYRNPSGEGALLFPKRVASIDRVTVDQAVISPSLLTLSEGGNYCTGDSLRTGSEIEVVVTFAHDSYRGRIAKCRRVTVYGGAQDNRLFCYRGEDPAVFYISRSVTPENAEISDGLLGTAGGDLYFPVDVSTYRVDAPVTAICRHYDRLLVFTATGAWAADCTGDTAFEVVPIHPSVGCDKEDGAALCGNVPVTYFGGRLWRWSAKGSSRNEYSAEVLSSPIAKRVRDLRDGEVSLAYFREREELWVLSPSDPDGTVLIYHLGKDAFYTFGGVYADCLVPSGNELLLLRGGGLYAFDEGLTADDGGNEIVASYASGWLSFGHPERTKRLVRFFLEGDPDGGRITVRFRSDRESYAATDLYGSGAPVEQGYDRRVSVGRFRYVRFLLEAGGNQRQRISAFSVTARR